jgi:2-dehydropantoate 2-reductase
LDVSAYDQVWLSISSTALRSDMVEAFLAKLSAGNENAPLLVSLLPGLDDRNWVLERYPASKLINGMISLIAYWAPLEDEPSVRPGWAFYFPPFGPSPFSGSSEGVASILDALKRGKQPAVAHRDVTGMSAFPTAVMMPLLAALELEGWKFDGLARGRWLDSALRAMSDTLGIVEAVKGKSRPLWSRFFSAFWVKAGLKVAPYLLPLPIETYLRVHFTKVGDQTLFFLKSWQTSAQQSGASSAELGKLATSLEALRSGV